MTKYYFLGTFLPELKIGEPPEINFKELEQLLKDNLTKKDLKKIQLIRNFYDILNLRFFWKREPLDPFGNFDENELEEALAVRVLLPLYVFEFVDKHESPEAKLKNFPELLATFFSKAIQSESGLFKAWLTLERELRLILVAFRARRLNRDVLVDLQFENPEETIVAQILAQKDSTVFEPPEHYYELKVIFEKYVDSPLDLQKALVEYRFKKIDEMIGFDFFSIDRILAYFIKLILVEKWQQMDQQRGREIVDNILKEIS